MHEYISFSIRFTRYSTAVESIVNRVKKNKNKDGLGGCKWRTSSRNETGKLRSCRSYIRKKIKEPQKRIIETQPIACLVCVFSCSKF